MASEEMQPGFRPVDFITLGMFIIDDTEFDNPPRVVSDVIGGAAAFAACGARMVAGKKYGQRISWVVDAGTDFPDHIKEQLDSWRVDTVYRANPDRLTTRAWNGYKKDTDEERRPDFQYLSPKRRLEASDLNEFQLMARVFHIISYPGRAIAIVKDIMRRREEIIRRRNLDTKTIPRPTFVWEPVPDCCIPEERAAIKEACRYVDVVSPNELELGTLLFGRSSWSPSNPEDVAEARRLLDSGLGHDGNGLLVVRRGKHGCCVVSKEQCSTLPAYQYAKVIDPTGGGNTFLGGFAQALITPDRPPVSDIIARMKSMENWADIAREWEGRLEVPAALACGTIAASLAIEQLGTPSPCSESDEDKWNGDGYVERLQRYLEARTLQ
ncbi:hypothetical protein KEM56_004561 [Ascosphaera pollenicola]|nr:hypothetical protein KEM56_004561 [Ascosphaera pollenicola]